MIQLLVLALCLAPALSMRRTGYIIGGTVPTPGKFPYMAALKKGDSVECGGALVSAHWVVTSAHCAALRMDNVVIGLHDKTDDSVGSPVYYSVMGFIRHESYLDDVNVGSPNDIGLVKIAEAAPEANYIALVQDGDTVDETDCTIMGWGHTEGGVFPKPLPNQIHSASVIIYSQDFCKGRWSQGQILNSHVCAGTDGKVVGCSNDRGGPLVCKVGDAHKLIGVMSFSTFSCVKNTPAVYTRITSFRDWIKTNTCGDVV